MPEAKNAARENFAGASDLEHSLSRPRFQTYLEHAGWDRRLAAELYLFNGELSGALMPTLGLAEVSLRNAVDRQLTAEFGNRWFESAKFLQGTLTDKGSNTLNRSLFRMSRRNQWTRDDLVADLSFDFWSNMFRTEYHEFWAKHVSFGFPHRSSENRHAIQQIVKDLNFQRNRIAHHEPILSSNVNATKGHAIKLISMICPGTSEWAKKTSRLADVIRKKPRKGGRGEILGNRADDGILILRGEETILDVSSSMKMKSPICVRSHEHGGGACTPLDIIKFLSIMSVGAGGLVDLSEMPISSVFDWMPPGGDIFLPKETPMSKVEEILTGPMAPSVVVAFDVETQCPTGAILRSHRRY